MNIGDLLTTREMKALEGLRLSPKRAFRGSSRGERISKKKGISIEFADFRNYGEGDDLRHLDWNVFARLDSPVVRTYQDEEELIVTLVIDASASMDFGDPTKLFWAKKLGFSLAYIALLGGDGVQTRLVGYPNPVSAISRSRSSAQKVFQQIDRDPSLGTESLTGTLSQIARSKAKTGVMIIVSDGLEEELPGAIRTAASRGFEVWFLQVLSPIEVNPDLEGDLRLIDSENGNATEITINRATLDEYRSNLKRHLAAVEESVVQVSGRYALVLTDEDWTETIQRKLVPKGWFQ